MPKSAKNEIYGELYKILKPHLTNDYWGCGEHAFHEHYGQYSTPVQKAQAIRNYLAGGPLLDHLGIAMNDYSTKLQCRPGHLQKIGIVSPDDLKLICSLSPAFQKLPIAKDVGVEENFRDNAVKAKADSNYSPPLIFKKEENRARTRARTRARK
jgi:hypothetical protein